MFSCEFCEGYGSTESCAYGSVLRVGDFSAGHVGTPPICSEVKLVAVPEMNYHVTARFQRRIVLPWPFLFQGYYKDPEKTAEAIDSDGWLHTGDIASYNPETGKISIIDRKKEYFQVEPGEYVAPENLEIVYVNCPWIAQIFVRRFAEEWFGGHNRPEGGHDGKIISNKRPSSWLQWQGIESLNWKRFVQGSQNNTV